MVFLVWLSSSPIISSGFVFRSHFQSLFRLNLRCLLVNANSVSIPESDAEAKMKAEISSTSQFSISLSQSMDETTKSRLTNPKTASAASYFSTLMLCQPFYTYFIYCVKLRWNKVLTLRRKAFIPTSQGNLTLSVDLQALFCALIFDFNSRAIHLLHPFSLYESILHVGISWR